MSTAASRSENLPRVKISSKSSPPLQILQKKQINSGLEVEINDLLSDEVVTLVILEELVHLDDIWVILRRT